MPVGAGRGLLAVRRLAAQYRRRYCSLGNNERALAVTPVEHVADGLAAQCVGFLLGMPLLGAHNVRAMMRRRRGLRLAASGAAVGKARLAGPQLELVSTHNTSLDREGHDN